MRKNCKILILTDGLGWIVDRITNEMISRISYEFTEFNYTEIATEDLLYHAEKHDLVHYQNWDLKYHMPRILEMKTPLLVSCRSHRYSEDFQEAYKKVQTHTITPELKEKFPNSTYIPDGIFEMEHEFTVGFAGRQDEYKGYRLIKKACDELGVRFKPAENLKPEEMKSYYDSIDLYVCASENEGHSTPVMECLSINKPVITTDVGIPKMFDVYKIERSMEGIKKGIKQFKTEDWVKNYTWENTCNQFKKLYAEIITGWRKN
ncbi:MAG: glycosyltransferase [Patescibacteria group bacterium]|nr:glycosyltransferase [Patescibacteria group bacterium]